MIGLIAPESLAAFTAVSLLLCISPGPDNLFVLTQSVLYGRSAGLYVTLGLCTGLIVHTAALALGVAALIKASPVSSVHGSAAVVQPVIIPVAHAVRSYPN